MAKISELPLGNDLALTDEIPVNRNGTNVRVLGKDVLTTKLRNPQPINLSGVVVGSAAFDGVSAANISTTLEPLSSGISNKVVVDDQTGYLKNRDINPFVWDTGAVPLTGSLNSKYLPKAIAPNSLINSVIVESDLNHIGIRIQPTVELTVGGQISATDSISTSVDLSAKENLYIGKHSILGNNLSSNTTINGTAFFPNASSSSLGLKIGGVSLYKSATDTLAVDGKLVVNQMNVSTLSNSVVTEEAGLLKYRPVNPQVWNDSVTFVEGSGHVDFIPRYTSPTSIQDSVICEKSAKIGIGTHSPNEKLTVNGSVSAEGIKVSGDYTPDGGIKFGDNVNLYRADNHVLRTDQNLIIGTIINDSTLDDVLTHDNGLVRQRRINSDCWDTTTRILRGQGTDLAIPIFGNDAVLRDSYMKQTAAGDIEINQKLFVGGSSGIDVHEEITKLKNFSENGCAFYHIKQNDSASPNPNDSLNLFSYIELSPPRINEAFISADNLIVLYNPADLIYSGSNVNLSSIEAFLIKFKIKARLERPTGSVEIQVRRNSSEPWLAGSGIINLAAEDFSDAYRVYSSTSEIVYHDKSTGSFEWRLSDADTTPFSSPFSSANVKYQVTAELLGFYFKQA